MAKDPAILFFFNDWHTGTMTMSRHLKGCYMDLLCAQFNSGHLSTQEIQTVLGNDFAAWQGALRKKFVQDEQGLFFNERLQKEIDKRKEFSQKQRERVNSRYRKPTENDTGTLPEKEMEMKIGIENKNSFLEKSEKPFLDSDLFEEIKKYFGFESEQKFVSRWSEIVAFLGDLRRNSKLDVFKSQFEFYKKYKAAADEKPHSFPGFINGGWDQENWEHKYNSLKKPDGKKLNDTPLVYVKPKPRDPEKELEITKELIKKWNVKK